MAKFKLTLLAAAALAVSVAGSEAAPVAPSSGQHAVAADTATVTPVQYRRWGGGYGYRRYGGWRGPANDRSWHIAT